MTTRISEKPPLNQRFEMRYGRVGIPDTPARVRNIWGGYAEYSFDRDLDIGGVRLSGYSLVSFRWEDISGSPLWDEQFLGACRDWYSGRIFTVEAWQPFPEYGRHRIVRCYCVYQPGGWPSRFVIPSDSE